MDIMDRIDVHETIMEIARGAFDLPYEGLDPGMIIHPDKNYVGIDYYDLMGFIVEIETVFSIEIPNDIIEVIKTIQDVINVTTAILFRLN